MNQEKDIQDLFSKLQNQSSSVRPELWQNIQQGAGLAGTGGAAAGGFSLLGKFFIAAAIVATVGTSAYLLTKDSENQEVKVENKTKTEASQSADQPVKEEETNQKPEPTKESKALVQAGVNETETATNAISENNAVEESENEVMTKPQFDNGETGDEDYAEEIVVAKEDPETVVQEEIKLTILSHQEEDDALDWLFTVEGPDAGSYYWTFTDGYSVSGTRVRHRFMNDGTYGVCVNVVGMGYQTGKECIDVEAMRKIVIAMPNVFTPGSSPGVNDLYDIDHAKSENIVQYRLLIYDSNGTLIFQSSEAQKAWNGNDRFGEPMPTGTYVCVVEAEGFAGQKSASRHSLTLKR